MIKENNLHPTVRARLNSVPRRAYHVCKPDAGNADYLYDSLPRGTLFTTVLEAVKQAQDYEDVFVWPGEYTENATISIGQQYLRLLAACFAPFHALEGTALWQLGSNTHESLTGANVPVVTIDGAHGVEVAGFGRIIPYQDGSAKGISIGETTECKGTWIHDNAFYAIEGSPGPRHIVMGASGVEAQYTLIEGNWLYCGGNHAEDYGMIEWVHATRATIRDNTFQVQGNSAGISGVHVYDEDYIRGQILDNRFWAMEQSLQGSASYAIKAEGTLVGGDLIITGNETVNFTAPFSDGDVTALGINYHGDAVEADA